jgi:beta-RFAP synthase
VEVRAPARLHLGFLDPSGGIGRRFLGLGLAIDRPATLVRAHPAARTRIEGPEAERVALLLERLRPLFGDRPVEIRILEAIPAHAGFGSGTQLALAVGRVLAALARRPFRADDVARLALRGRRSGLGIAAFARGGFLLDGGRGTDGGPPPLLARLPFPSGWRVLLLRDPGREGLSGEAEERAFRELPPFPERLAERLSRLALCCVLPGVAVGDLALFGRGLGEIQDRLGDWYAPFQGGSRWSSALVAAALDHLRTLGIAASGQSSWGPTGFAVVRREDAAALRAEVARRFPGLCVEIARGRNRGVRPRSGTVAARCALARACADADMRV